MDIKNVVDIIILSFVVINLFLGWRKGLILSVFNFFGIIVSFIISKKYYAQFGDVVLKNINWVNEFRNNIFIKINNSFGSNAEIFNNINNGTLLNKLDLPEYLNTGINQFLRNTDITKVDNVSVELADIIVSVIMNFISFVLLFIVLILFIKIIGIVLNMIFQLPVLKGINQFGGLAIGFIISNVFIFVFMAIIVLLYPMNLDFGLKEIVDQSTIGSLYYNNNLLLVLINYYL
jgi:uncharacterized membrane protein required for colicin V production